jgi:DNA-binding winged helix-turn-helix (wHTH) protein
VKPLILKRVFRHNTKGTTFIGSDRLNAFMEAAPRTRIFRFGAFELDTDDGELRKHGVRLRLQDQPLKILVTLLEKPGKVVSREDLARTVWTDGVFVDYEGGLNAAVTRLRQTLGDSAEQPRFIETVARKGYRFIGSVVTDTGLSEGATLAPRAMPTAAARPLSRRRWLWGIGGAVALGAAAVVGTLAGRKPRIYAPIPSKVQEANEYLQRAQLFLTTQGDVPRGRQMLEKALELDAKFAHARAWYGFTDWLLVSSGYSNDTIWLYRAEEELRQALLDDPNSARAHAALGSGLLVAGA